MFPEWSQAPGHDFVANRNDNFVNDRHDQNSVLIRPTAMDCDR